MGYWSKSGYCTELYHRAMLWSYIHGLLHRAISSSYCRGLLYRAIVWFLVEDFLTVAHGAGIGALWESELFDHWVSLVVEDGASPVTFRAEDFLPYWFGAIATTEGEQ
jgi:hypothetical protein